MLKFIKSLMLLNLFKLYNIHPSYSEMYAEQCVLYSTLQSSVPLNTRSVQDHPVERKKEGVEERWTGLCA